MKNIMKIHNINLLLFMALMMLVNISYAQNPIKARPDQMIMVDSVEEILTLKLGLGDRVKVKSSGAEYLVQADSVAGYTNDSIAVVPNDNNYFVLQNPSAKTLGFKLDSTAIQKKLFVNALNFCNIINVPFFANSGIYNFSNLTTLAGELSDINIIGEGAGNTIFYNIDEIVLEGNLSVKNLAIKNSNEVFKQRSSTGSFFNGEINIILNQVNTDSVEELVQIQSDALLTINELNVKDCNFLNNTQGQGFIINKKIKQAVFENCYWETPNSSFTSLLILGDNLDICDKVTINNCRYYNIYSTGAAANNIHGALIYSKNILISNCSVDSTNIFRFYPRGRNAKIENTTIRYTDSYPNPAITFTPVIFKAGSLDNKTPSLVLDNVNIDAFDNPALTIEGYGYFDIVNSFIYTSASSSTDLITIDQSIVPFMDVNMNGCRLENGSIRVTGDSIVQSINISNSDIINVSNWQLGLGYTLKELNLFNNNITLNASLINPSSSILNADISSNRISLSTQIPRGNYDLIKLIDNNLIYDQANPVGGIKDAGFYIDNCKTCIIDANYTEADSVRRYNNILTNADTVFVSNNVIKIRKNGQLSPVRFLNIADSLDYLSVKENVVNISNGTGDIISLSEVTSLAIIENNIFNSNASNTIGGVGLIDSLIYSDNRGVPLGTNNNYNLIGAIGRNYANEPLTGTVKELNILLEQSYLNIDTLQTQAQQFESNYQFTPFAYTGLDILPVDTLLSQRFVVTGALDGKTITGVEYTLDNQVTTDSTLVRLLKYTPSTNTYTSFGNASITVGNSFVNNTPSQSIAQGDIIYCETTQTGDNVTGLTVTLKIE